MMGQELQEGQQVLANYYNSGYFLPAEITDAVPATASDLNAQGLAVDDRGNLVPSPRAVPDGARALPPPPAPTLLGVVMCFVSIAFVSPNWVEH